MVQVLNRGSNEAPLSERVQRKNEARRLEILRAGVIEKRDAYERAVRGLVAEGMKRGEFARTDPALVTRAMLGAVNWTARWYRPEGPRSVAEIADSLSDYLVRGLVPTK